MKLSLHPATAAQPGKPTAPPSPRAAQLLALQRQVTAVRSRRATRHGKRLPPQQPPVAQTHAYLKALLGPVHDARAAVEAHLVAQIPALARAASRGQAVHSHVIAAVSAAASAWARQWPARRLQQMVAIHGQRISAFQREQLLKQLAAGLGRPPTLADRAAARLVPAWTAAGATKLHGIVATYFQQVAARALAALKPVHTDGSVHRDAPPPPPPPPDGGMGEPGDEDFVLRGQISAGDVVLDLGTRGDVLESRAGQLADLDVRSLFADLNQDRQKELGLDSYTWTTMEDDRVRPEHAALDGRTFSWDSPPAIGNPGEPPGCRCQATPVLQ